MPIFVESQVECEKSEKHGEGGTLYKNHQSTRQYEADDKSLANKIEI